MKLNKVEIVNVWLTYRDEINIQEHRGKPYFSHMFDSLESEVLYSLVRYLKPLKLVEFSPNRGWTSAIMLEALRENRSQDPTYTPSLKSFDLTDLSEDLDCEGEISRKLIIGDALHTVPPNMGECDFLFIDSDHSAGFTDRYLKKIVPLYKKGFIWVHDWNGFHAEREKLERLYPEGIGFVIDSFSAEPAMWIKHIDENKFIKPVLNLMDYWVEDISIENGVRCSSNIYIQQLIDLAPGYSLDRSPSQILYKN